MVYISAIIPVYNQERYLAEAIDSVLNQTFKDFEVTVVDDGSTDKTPEVIASYSSRIRSIRQPNGGFPSALNHGIREAKGEWIGWLSSDDSWEPEKLAVQISALEGNQNVGLIYADVFSMDAESRIIERQSFPCPAGRDQRLKWLARRCFINGSSTLIRRSVFQDVGLYDESDRLTSDYDMWLRIAERYDILHVPKPLVRYRIHPGQMSKKRISLERSSKRVVSRAFRRLGPVRGGAIAALRIKDEVLSLPWKIKRAGGDFTLLTRIRELGYTARTLVDPDAQ